MEFEAKRSIIAPEGVFIIGTYDPDTMIPNCMNAAWGAQSDFDEITLFIGKHKTSENLKKTKAFTLAFATVDTLEISDYFGLESGQNVNKIEKAGCHTHPSKHVNAPIIEEYPVTLECQVKSYDEESEILVGKILAMQVDESCLSNGKVDYDKLKPITYDISTNTYRVIGPVVGHAFKDGLSIKNR